MMNNDLDILVKICHANLLSNKNKCFDYLIKERCLSLTDIKKYNLGYFPQNPKKLLNFISENELIRLSILEYSGKSSFSDYFYLIFPLYSEYGDVIGIGGRTLVGEKERELLNIPKYKNSSFKKAQNLYGLNLSKKEILRKKNVYIVEGYFDQISLSKNGIENSVAVCGTAFSKNHFMKLTKYTDKLTFILDNDDAGKQSMEKIYSKYINLGIKLRFLSVPKNCKDIDDYFKLGGDSKNFQSDLKSFIPGWST